MSLAKLRIVAINDCYELKNLPKLQTLLKTLTPAATAVLLAGDFLSPSTLSSIDGGRGMIATLRAAGLTHACLGNHEADLPLHTLKERITDLSKSATLINTNLLHPPKTADWLTSSLTPRYSILQSPCRKVRVALFGLLSDETGVFRNGKFKGVNIENVLETFRSTYHEVVPSLADFVIPMTHQSIVRDQQLARYMLDDMKIGSGLIVGGHEHEPFNVKETLDGESVQIIKSGSDATHASLIDLSFEISGASPKLKEIESTLLDLQEFEDSPVVKKIVESHTSVVDKLETEVIFDESTSRLPPGKVLSSERTRFQQTTVGAVLCQAIKDELEVDVAIINGATIKGNTTYMDNKMSYAQLKKELPFPTKMVVVEMERWELHAAIQYSRTSIEDGADQDAAEIARRGYLQVDLDFELDGFHTGEQSDILHVALPRNLLNGFCKIKPLMDIGDRLKAAGTFPGPDDFIPALTLVVRNSCKNRWFYISSELMTLKPFDELDLNHDGVLDAHEVKLMMKKYLGREPPDFVIEDMIASIDADGNGLVDMGEFSFFLATMEREQQWKKVF